MVGVGSREIHSFAVIVLAGAAVACQPMSPIATSGTAKPGRGAWFAQEYTCAGCHAVERGGVSRDRSAPPFGDIVNREEVTASTLVASIHNAHKEMTFDPQSMLDELVAHMLTLQDPKYRQPS